MLNIDNIVRAIQYLYKDQGNLTVGSPLPYVRTFDTFSPETDIVAFNELMIDGPGGVKHIFYGTVTWELLGGADPVTARIAVTNYPKLDASVTAVCFDIAQFLEGRTPDFKMGITRPMFIQQVVLEANATINFDGYVFALEVKS